MRPNQSKSFVLEDSSPIIPQELEGGIKIDIAQLKVSSFVEECMKKDLLDHTLNSNSESTKNITAKEQEVFIVNMLNRKENNGTSL